MKSGLRSRFLLESLEPRLMFSADLALLPADGGALAAEASSVLEFSLAANGGEQALQAELSPVREVVFIDSGIDDYQTLLDDLSSGSDGDRLFDTVILDASSDGIAQISSYLAQQQDVAAVHIISHGSDGEALLGNTTLNLATLDYYADAIEGWQLALTGEADLLFYGCNLAEGTAGKELVDSLSLLTGADVAASEDLTGSALSGGDWLLEYSRGEIEVEAAVSSALQQDWQAVLVAPTNTITNAVFDETASTITLSGSGFTTINPLLPPDVKSQMDWSKITWDTGAAIITFAENELSSVEIISDNTLTLNLTSSKTNDIVTTAGFGNADGVDAINILAGFSTDGLGNAATTDAYSGNVTTSSRPQAADNTFAILEEGAYDFIAADFNYYDAEGDSLDHIEISILPDASEGVLTLSGINVSSGQSIALGQIGNLTFTPETNLYGLGAADFRFKVSDGIEDSKNSYTITFDITPVGDTPTVDNIVTLEDTLSSLIYIGPHADDGLEVTHFRISNITNGTLYQADGVTTIFDGEYITRAEGVAGVIFMPTENSNLSGSFDVESSEDGTSVAAQSGVITSNINVTPVNDAPVGGFVVAEEIPAAQISQSRNGDGIVTINWKATDVDSASVTLSDFMYSDDGGSNWHTLASDAPLGGGWAGSYAPVASFGSASSYSFTFNTQHLDVAAPSLTGRDVPDVQVKFKVFDGTDYSAEVLSENFRVDNVAPTPNITSAHWHGGGDRLHIQGSNFYSIAPKDTDLTTYNLDWNKIVIKVYEGGVYQSDITFDSTDILEAMIDSDGDINIQFTDSKEAEIEATFGFGDGDDTLLITTGFFKDYFGNEATTDGTLGTPPEPLNGSESYTEDTLLAFSDTLQVTDVDGGIITVTLTLSDPAGGSLNVGTFGTATSTYDAATGYWETSGVIADVNELLKGLEFTPVLNYDSDFTIFTKVSDGLSASVPGSIVMTATPVNDAPVITNGPDTADLDETDASLSTSGSLTVTDVDTTDVVTATRTLVVTGTSDRTDLAAPTDTELLAMFSITPSATLDGTQTSATLDWSFDSGAETFDYLATGETLVLTYTIQATDDDGTPLNDTETVTITITGTNDAPVITNGPDTAALDETDAALTAGGSLTVSDVDTTDLVSATRTLVVTGTSDRTDLAAPTDTELLAMFSITPSATLDGTQTSATLDWSFDSGAETFDYLATGETLVLTYTIQATDDDGTPLNDTETVTITITGTNDAPVITNGPDTAALDETDAALTAGGSLTVSDVDTTDLVSATRTLVVTGTSDRTDLAAPTDTELLAMFSITPSATLDGTQTSATLDWSFDSGAETFDYLATGETLVLTYTIQATDDDGTPLNDTETVTITITGTNDAPVITNGPDTAALDETDAALTAGGSLTVSDVDTTDLVSATRTLVVTGTSDRTDLAAPTDTELLAMFSITPSATLDGTQTSATLDWSFDSGAETFDYLATGETLVLTYTIQATDDDGTPLNDTETVTITITGTNDAPVITNGPDTAALDETDAALTAGGSLTVSDVDTTDLVSATRTLVVTGTSDRTDLAAPTDTELLAMFSITPSATLDGTQTSATLDWSFDSGAETFDYLATGETLVLTYTIQATDDDGTPLNDTETVTITITGTNDAPVITNGPDTAALDETDAALTAGGSLTVSDVDTTDLVSATRTLVVTGTSDRTDLAAPTDTELLAMFSMTPSVTLDGTQTSATLDWSFDSGAETFDYLATGETLVLTYTIQATDDDGTPLNDTETVTITITGTNDAPVAITSLVSTNEDTEYNFVWNDFNFTDLESDSLSSITITGQNLAGGTLQLLGANVTNGDTILKDDIANLVYTPPSNANGNPLANFTFAINDADNGSVTATMSINVKAVNDQPVANDDFLNAVEDNALTFAPVTALLSNDSDLDGDSLTLQSFNQPANGTLSLDASGNMVYQPTSNYYGNDSFTYTISDGNGGTADGAALIIIAPIADTPQVDNVSTPATVQSDLIVIQRHANDGAEVTHFKISGITGGTLYLADGTTQIHNGDFITAAQGQAGVKFTPATGSSTDGTFQIEASLDGVIVSGTGKATSTITVIPPMEPPKTDAGEVPEEEPAGEEPDSDEEPAEESAPPAETTEAGNDQASPKASDIDAPTLQLNLPSPGFVRLDAENDFSFDKEDISTSQTLKGLLEATVFNELRDVLDNLDLSTLSQEAYELMRSSLDDFKEELDSDARFERAVIGTAVASSIGLSAGYVVWVLKGGSLLASVLSSMPAWHLADPLSILAGNRDDEEDEESLETIIEDGAKDDDEKKKNAADGDGV